MFATANSLHVPGLTLPPEPLTRHQETALKLREDLEKFRSWKRSRREQTPDFDLTVESACLDHDIERAYDRLSNHLDKVTK